MLTADVQNALAQRYLKPVAPKPKLDVPHDLGHAPGIAATDGIRGAIFSGHEHSSRGALNEQQNAHVLAYIDHTLTRIAYRVGKIWRPVFA